ncbi:uncharacterized protein LOC126985254 [Eriocheir sinensis]|uniref:uncharacterized protein LOC126985254 n=1 Tax=Eriocheir sinensis TaxID=95602 RepID=UPI0021C8E9CB|nr:uncharacterized protein LOC126985254 [Eriocheir sinensis]
MKILTTLLLVTSPFLALAASSSSSSSVSRDGGHGGAAHPHPPQPQGGGSPPSSSYEGPPPPYDLYDPQPPPAPQVSGPQFQYHSFQPNYLEPVWQPQETGGLSTWLDKGLGVLGDVLPVALSVVCILALLTFLGLVKIPFITNISEARAQIGRALASVDVDQLANTVNVAIDKYHEMFGGPENDLY